MKNNINGGGLQNVLIDDYKLSKRNILLSDCILNNFMLYNDPFTCKTNTLKTKILLKFEYGELNNKQVEIELNKLIISWYVNYSLPKGEGVLRSMYKKSISISGVL